MEKTNEFWNLRKVVHRVYCDDCDIELEFDNVVLTSYPAQYPYHCPNCGKVYTFWETYPWTEIIGDEVQVDHCGKEFYVKR